MKYKTSNLVVAIFFLAALVLSSCKNNPVTPNPQNLNLINFEVEYFNNAWGYTRVGVYIDSTGALHHYDFQGSGETPLSDTARWFTQDQLAKKYNHRDTTLMFINLDTIGLYRSDIPWTYSGVYSDRKEISADGGIFTYIAYQYFPDIKKYHQIVLRVEGDWEYYDKSPYAQQLAAWLANYRQYIF